MAWQIRIKDRGTVEDTIQLIAQTIRRYHNSDTVNNAIKRLDATASLIDFLEQLFEFICDNVIYERDPVGHEMVTTPKRLLEDAVGDCKKMSVFIGAVLLKKNIPFYLKVVSYNKIEWAHIYIIVPLEDGTYVIVDPVNNCKFNKEVNYRKSRIYNVNGKVMTLSLLGRTESDESMSVAGVIGELDDDLFNISGLGMGELDDEDADDTEIGIYSLAGMGILGRRKKGKRKARRKEKRAKKKKAKSAIKIAKKAKKAKRKARKKALKALPRKERKAVKKQWRKEKRARRKFAREAKKLGKSEGLPGQLSKFIGKYPEIWMMYFAKNDEPEYELSEEGKRKYNRIAFVVNKVKKKKDVDPAQLLAFVDTVIEKKYGMSAEEFIPVWIGMSAQEKGVLSGGIGEPGTASAVIAGLVALAGAIVVAVVGVDKKDINEGDLPDEGDLIIGGDEGEASSSEKKKGVLAWVAGNAGSLIGIAKNAAQLFDKETGGDPSGSDIDNFSQPGQNTSEGQDKKDDKIFGLPKIPVIAVGTGVVGFGLYQWLKT